MEAGKPRKAEFPLARCGTCGRQDLCGPRRRPEPDYPRCHRPLLRGNLRRHEELLDALCGEAGIGDGAPVREMLSALLARFDRDRRTVSEVLEPSLSSSGTGPGAATHLLRFSYAFHGYRRDVRGASESVRAMIAPFGDDDLAFAEPILRLAEGDPLVHQLMFGYAHDGPGRERLKLYLQLRDDGGARALRIAEELVPGSCGATSFGALPLHLLGIDFRSGRLLGAKLYHLEAHRPLDEATAARAPLLGALRTSGVESLRDLLWISRVAAGRQEAAEIDFSLADNELHFGEVAALPPLSRHLPPEGPWASLSRRFRLAVRRLSVPVEGDDKLNLYYMLAEAET